jgi:Leucine Rich repeat
LENNGIGDSGAVKLAYALTRNSNLLCLDLENNRIGDRGAAALAEALKVNSTLDSLNLRSNDIGVVGATAIHDALKENNCSLMTLYLDQDISPAMCSAIDALVRANAAGIRLIRAETGLRLTATANSDGNIISCDEAKQIATELAVNTTLKRLDLNENDIGHDGAVAIARALKKNQVLTVLGLFDNRINDVGASAIAEALLDNSTLQSLSLSDNGIGDIAALVFADVLESNTTLTNLDLDCNNIGDAGASAILKTLKIYNCTLMSLDLAQNEHISPVLLQQVDDMLASRRVLAFWLKRSSKEVDVRLFPLVVRRVQRADIDDNKETGNAGFIFYLARSTASKKYSAVAQEAATSRKRSREP